MLTSLSANGIYTHYTTFVHNRIVNPVYLGGRRKAQRVDARTCAIGTMEEVDKFGRKRRSKWEMRGGRRDIVNNFPALFSVWATNWANCFNFWPIPVSGCVAGCLCADDCPRRRSHSRGNTAIAEQRQQQQLRNNSPA